MEELILALNDPANQGAPETVQDLQRRIQLLQRESSAWSHGLEFLRHQNATIRFYGALTLTVKINADWEKDGLAEQPQLRLNLLQNLLNSYIFLVDASDAPFVLRKLCSTLATLYLKPGSGWRCPLAETILSFVAGHYVPLGGPPPSLEYIAESVYRLTFTQLRAVLWLCDTLAEEVAKVDSGASREASLQTKMVTEEDDHVLLIQSLLLEDILPSRQHGTGTRHLLDHSQTEDLVKLVLDQLPRWATLIESVANQHNEDPKAHRLSLSQNVDRVFACFDNASLSDHVIQCLVALMQRPSSSMGRGRKAQLNHIVQSPQGEAWVESQLKGDAEGTSFVEFLDCLVDQEDLSSPHYLTESCLPAIIPILQQLLQSEGVPNVENDTVTIVLEDLSKIVEGYADWEEESVYASQMQDMILDVCNSCLAKASYPIEEMTASTQTWDADDRTKFRDFRNDVTDFLQSAFACIGQQVVHYITQDLLSEAAQSDFSLFEAGLFCLGAFSDTMANDVGHYDDMINVIFNSSQWNRIVQASTPVPDRARQGAISFLGHNTSYLQRHREQLLPCLHFLFSSLQRSGAIHASARAIYTLCHSQRTVLAPVWPQFIESIGDLSQLLPPDRHRLFAAVASVVQGIVSEQEKIEPISRLLDLIEASALPMEEKRPPEEVIAYATDSMQTLAAIGRGLKAPPENTIVLDGEDVVDRHFWIAGPGRSVQDRAFNICSNVLSSCGNDDAELVTAACDFVRSGYSEQHPSPFKFNPQTSIDFYHTLLGRTPHVEAVLSSASAFLASTSPDAITASQFAHLIDPVINVLWSQPDTRSATFDFFTRLLPRWTPTWFGLPSAPVQLQLVLGAALDVLAEPDTLPRRASAALLAAMLDVPHDICTEPSLKIIHLHLPRLVGGVFHLLAGECARSEIDALSQPLRGLVAKYSLLTRPLIRDAMRDDAQILSPRALEATTTQQRLRFVAQVEAVCRGGGGNRRKLVELVREFWVVCRGAVGLGYIA